MSEPNTPMPRITSGTQLRETCKLGQGEACCRYVVVDKRGFFRCAKRHEIVSAQINAPMRASVMVARGDNCTGAPDFHRFDKEKAL